MDYVRIIYAQTSLMLAHGFITLILGLIIITLHPQWFMGPGVITTVIGWLACVKGAMLLWCPQGMIKTFPLKMFNNKVLKVESLVVIVLGAVLVYYSRQW